MQATVSMKITKRRTKKIEMEHKKDIEFRFPPNFLPQMSLLQHGQQVLKRRHKRHD